jgi:hypothetical protein
LELDDLNINKIEENNLYSGDSPDERGMQLLITTITNANSVLINCLNKRDREISPEDQEIYSQYFEDCTFISWVETLLPNIKNDYLEGITEKDNLSVSEWVQKTIYPGYLIAFNIYKNIRKEIEDS